jgi:thymidine kinase
MALTFYYGTMSAGKTSLALQKHHNLREQQHNAVLLTMNTRDGNNLVSSRVGISARGILLHDDSDIVEAVLNMLGDDSLDSIHSIICDEAHFYAPSQVDQLAELADRSIDVLAYGLRTDFTGKLFPGSQRFIELADHLRHVQGESVCWCGRPAMFNSRVVDGKIVYEGPQVLVGDVAPNDSVCYRVLCRKHYRQGALKATCERS